MKAYWWKVTARQVIGWTILALTAILVLGAMVVSLGWIPAALSVAGSLLLTTLTLLGMLLTEDLSQTQKGKKEIEK